MEPAEGFLDRHLGPDGESIRAMLAAVGAPSLEALVEETVPASIRLPRPLDLPAQPDEQAFLAELKSLAARNRVAKSYIGMGYSDCHTPPVILRNVLENPGWYTAYTPYQAEIAQGRLEALLNFQTMVEDLTGLPIANASLLDEATAAAEAMSMLYHASRSDGAGAVFFASDACHPQTLDVLRTRSAPLGIELAIGDATGDLPAGTFGLLLQYPGTRGEVLDYAAVCARAKAVGARVAVATDLLALALLKPPGEWGADVAVGSSQRFGVPMGYGGPHAAFFAARDEYRRLFPGRIIGVTVDAHGRPALRMALQTREQHIRREKATSNICTSQVLLAVVAGLYAAWHGPDGIAAIAGRVHGLARSLAGALGAIGYRQRHAAFFDTLDLDPPQPGALERLRPAASAAGINFRYHADGRLGISLDETTNAADAEAIARLCAEAAGAPAPAPRAPEPGPAIPSGLRRTSPFLAHPTFHRHRSETAMLRYLKALESKDLSLAQAMIPLGSCTMKLNATSEMIPITWPEFARMHPFAPADQARGYRELFDRLEGALAAITGLAACSLQPNAGSQGEYAGLLVIRAYHRARGQARRDLVLIPSSAHGTNPASAALAGFRIEVVKCDASGNIDLADLKARADAHAEDLAALMVTYPSTHGVFEEGIREACALVHARGGQVYLDGANLNAQVGLCSPGSVGADVCHLNLHKTFCIPHGGGGPGMGPICVAEHLRPFLPGHPVVPTGGDRAIPAVAAAPWGSAGILPISWAYIRMMGGAGLTRATQVAILNANYLKARLEGHYPVLYVGARGRVAHEMILDCRDFKRTAGVEVEDIAKRLMDYGFHAPTVSFPVPGTLMVEPTESEPREELDRFAEALIAIRGEIRDIEGGRLDRADNPLKHAPHTAEAVATDAWPHAYGRERAAFPLPWVRQRKFWPAVGRVNNAQGDKNLVCACPPMEAYQGV